MPRRPVHYAGAGPLEFARPATPNVGWENAGAATAAGAQARVDAQQTAQAAQAPPPAPTTSQPTAQQQADAAVLQSASATIRANLAGNGLAGMGDWAVSLASSLAGQGLTASDIVTQVTSELNNPKNADGSVNQQALDAFNAAMPGYNARIQTTGNNGGGISSYLDYMSQVQAFAHTAGLAPGTLTQEMIGNAWGRDVSSNEMSSRITQGYVGAENAMKAAPETKDYLEQQGISTSDLASYFLNPENALPVLQQKLNAAVVGGAAAQSGFSPELSLAQSRSLSAFLASSNQSGMGGVGAVTVPGASNAFTSSLGAGLGSAAELAQAGFEHAGPAGANAGPGTVDQNTLLEAMEGNASATERVRRATETRTAASQGGGGFASTDQGVQGVGFGSS